MVRLGRCMVGKEISRITRRNQWRLSFDDGVLHQYTLEVREILTVVTVRNFFFLDVILTESFSVPRASEPLVNFSNSLNLIHWDWRIQESFQHYYYG